MWTDPHISEQLLNIHLNPDIDLGSRKFSTIISTADWFLGSLKEKGELNILDLGCGPGLYAEIFAEKGHRVTGVDISKTSIDHAKDSARIKSLDIKYVNASYLDLELEEDTYDLIVLIYTDLGVLFPDDRESLLKKVYAALKSGGVFIFDVIRDTQLEQRLTPKNWEAVQSGFWRDYPYLALSESFLFKEQKVILYQHIVVDDEGNYETYRFWTHFFSPDEIKQMLLKQGFSSIYFRDDILPEGDIWNGDNVLFTTATK